MHPFSGPFLFLFFRFPGSTSDVPVASVSGRPEGPPRLRHEVGQRAAHEGRGGLLAAARVLGEVHGVAVEVSWAVRKTSLL